MTRHTSPDGAKDSWPLQRGFDRYFGTLVGAGSFYTPKALTRDNTPIAPPPGFFYTDAINENASTFIRDHARERPGAPFFVYIAHTAPHWPLHAPKEDIARYRGRYMEGWDVLRTNRRRRMVELGIIDKRWPLSPRDPSAHAWEEVPPEKKQEMDLRMATYAAQIDRVDQGLGRLLETLKRTGNFDNTLILFLADNGGCAEGGIWGFERKKGGELGTDSSFASYGLSWANASNTPFRRYKHWVHEGGISTPLIAHWPNGIKAKGQLRHQPGHVIDVMATCVDIAQTTYPKEHAGEAIRPLEGCSLMPAFVDHPIERYALFWEHEGNRAVRQGKWKLVAKHGDPWELYDLEKDRTEVNDVAAQYPAKAGELLGLYGDWAERCGVLPWPVKTQREGQGSRKKEFHLKHGDELDQASSPRIARRSFHIEAAVESREGDGVLVSQGGSRVGYSLYVNDGRPVFAMRNHGVLQLVNGPAILPKSPFKVAVAIAKSGTVTLTVNGTDSVSAEHEVMYDMPTEGLQVGKDLKAPVGVYQSPNEFHGKIDAVHIHLE